MSTVTIGGFLADLDRIIAGHRAANWDVDGLQLGDPAGPARVVGVCHEVTESVVEAVEDRTVDLLVTYHPLLFRPTNRLVAGRSPSGRALRLVAAGTALAVAHTSFDVAKGGTADALAAALGLGDVRGFGHLVAGPTSKVVTFLPADSVEAVAAAMAGAGGGRIGAYSGCSFRSEGIGAFLPGATARPVVGAPGQPSREAETRLEMVTPEGRLDAVLAALLGAHPYEEPAFDVYEVRSNLGMVGRIGRIEPEAFGDLAERVSRRLDAIGVRAAGPPDRAVERVAVVPGSGGGFVSAASAAGADVLVTGDVSHHVMVEALDRGMAVLDIGHTAGERPGMEALVSTVARLDAEVVDLGIDPRPW